ncbi:hypothetical protein ZWY2020_019849 [Hordeum vulgare]|nr:hypothetical protein ZWY2020_019849 [Hordeum vulgare]
MEVSALPGGKPLSEVWVRQIATSREEMLGGSGHELSFSDLVDVVRPPPNDSMSPPGGRSGGDRSKAGGYDIEAAAGYGGGGEGEEAAELAE